MHELAITESIFRIALREAQRSGAKRVLSIRLCLGDYSDIMPDYVEKYFSLVSEGSIASGARILARRERARVRCEDCGAEGSVEKGQTSCPVCASENIRMLSGTECLVESIEVE